MKSCGSRVKFLQWQFATATEITNPEAEIPLDIQILRGFFAPFFSLRQASLAARTTAISVDASNGG
jgi:hypothetical protein